MIDVLISGLIWGTPYVIGTTIFPLLIMYKLDKNFTGDGFGLFGCLIVKGLNKIFRK